MAGKKVSEMTILCRMVHITLTQSITYTLVYAILTIEGCIKSHYVRLFNPSGLINNAFEVYILFTCRLSMAVVIRGAVVRAKRANVEVIRPHKV